MNIHNITLENFRNYRELSLETDPGVNLIVGDNAQGKTNLLEAIGYLGSGKSFRALKTAEMVRFGAEFAEMEGSVFAQERNQTLRWLLFPGSRARQLFRQNGYGSKGIVNIGNSVISQMKCFRTAGKLAMKRGSFFSQTVIKAGAVGNQHSAYLAQPHIILRQNFQNGRIFIMIL